MMAALDREKIKRIIQRKRKIVFLRNKWWKFEKFKNDPKWRRPKGKDNPMRLKLKGHPPVVSVGYRTPRVIRGLHPQGLKPVVVHSVRELESLDPSSVIVYIGATVGARKRVELINKAKERGFLIANAG